MKRKRKEKKKKKNKKKTSTTHCPLHDDDSNKTAWNKGSQSGPLTERDSQMTKGSGWWVLQASIAKNLAIKQLSSPPLERKYLSMTEKLGKKMM